ncbi:hypothetical protein N9478_10355 [Gammaproteobacteria bacterium]|nr:hypothetical protein [Gammaproteobacteria bacterium]
MHDFANYRNTTYLEASEPVASEWTLDVPSLLMGVIVGIFVAIIGFKVAENRIDQVVVIEAPVVEAVEEKPFKFDFYEALKVYEVLPRG